MVLTSHILLASCGGRVGDISPNPLCAYLGISWGDLTYLIYIYIYIYIYICHNTHVRKYQTSNSLDKTGNVRIM